MLKSACLLFCVLYSGGTVTEGKKDTSNIEQSSDSLLIHLVNAVNKLMTQHAVDMTKLQTRIGKIEKRMGKIEKEMQTQNTLYMEELKKVKEHNGKLQKQQEMMEKNHERDVKTINGSLSTKQPVTPVVGFHVALDHQQSTGGKVAFNRILSNYGNGWNNITHTYKVPTKGLYFLTLTVMNFKNTAWAYLKRGSRNLQVARADDGHWWNVGTTSTVLVLEEGEHIYAQFGAGTLYSDHNLYTHLAGFLVQKTK